MKEEDDKRREEQEQQEASRTPEGRWRMELRRLSEAEILDLVRIHLGENPQEPLEDPDERRAFAEAVMATELVSYWRQSKRRDPQTRAGGKILRKRALLVRDALETC